MYWYDGVMNGVGRLTSGNLGLCTYVRQTKMKRADVQYVINNDEILMVNQYLGCVIDEPLELNDMVEEMVVAGKKALGAWFS